MINDVIATMDSVAWNMEDENEAELSERFSQIKSIMEDIRSANLELRTWGNDLHIENEELEKENNNLHDIITDLKQEIHELTERQED